jgi:hypothetical protein
MPGASGALRMSAWNLMGDRAQVMTPAAGSISTPATGFSAMNSSTVAEALSSVAAL